MPKLYFKYGSMNSGKTTSLLQTAYNYKEKGYKVIIAKPKIDTKGENMIVSRIGLARKVDWLIEESTNIFEHFKEEYSALKAKCFLIDESQFLKPSQVDDLLKIVVCYNIDVITYGLRTDFKMVGFSGASRLLEISQVLEELGTICKCSEQASLNIRFIDNIPTLQGEQILIDQYTNVIYESLCPKCYFKQFNLN